MSDKRNRSLFRRFLNGSWLRYSIIVISCLALLSPFLFIPQLFGNDDLCGGLCIRRFYLYFPGMDWNDFTTQVKVSAIGAGALALILLVTFFFGRLWCGYLCPMGGFPELMSRLFHDRWKIDYRALPQIPIRYGYFITYLVVLPAVGFSACTLCNFITIPRLFEALGGGTRGILFLVSTIGAVNLALVILLGFFAKLGRGYCQFLCPVGAVDGLVNRIGARLPFVRRTRVERSRCTGCRVCAEVCICGAIRMENRIAVVDQLSCMSCRECVIACEWGAIDWVTLPSAKMPARLRKGVTVAPPPVWTAVAPRRENRGRGRRIALGLLAGLALLLAAVHGVQGAQRFSDPDGCLTCHGLKGLAYMDTEGVIRESSLNPDHYAGSIHGSVPCKDCHRKIVAFPHQPENGEVDCAESCHVEEPSRGEEYTHKPIVEEFQASTHGKGATKGFTAAKRIDDDRNDAPPSCLRCHSNTLYIPKNKMPLFQEALDHGEEACGNCHQGEVWKKQIGGHILRRLISARWSKEEEVGMCKECHSDKEAMANVDRQDAPNGDKKPSDAHFILAADSYDMSLHGRLIAAGNDLGATCLDCHAPDNYRHAILVREEPDASAHPSNLDRSCGANGCHAYVKNRLNEGFLNTDVHSLDTLPAYPDFNLLSPDRFHSNWTRSLAVLTPPVALFVAAGLLWTLFDWKRGRAIPIVGGRLFNRRMLNRKPRKKPAKTLEERTRINTLQKRQKQNSLRKQQTRMQRASRGTSDDTSKQDPDDED